MSLKFPPESLQDEINELHHILRRTNVRITRTPRDLTADATWTVSTAKPGNGIECLLDNRSTTFWQSDGNQPHRITAHFPTKVSISEVDLYMDVDTDESYTPAYVSIRAGSCPSDMKDIRRHFRIRNPRGWLTIPAGEYVHRFDDWSDEESDEEQQDAEALQRRKQRQIKRDRKLAMKAKLLHEKWQRECTGVNGEWMRRKNRAVTKAFMLQIVIHCNHQNGRDSRVRMIRVLGGDQCSSVETPFSTSQFQRYLAIR